MKNRMSGLLMEVGAEYSKQRLHGAKYFSELLDQLEEVPESVKDLLRLSRGALETFAETQRQLLDHLQKDPLLVKRGDVNGATLAVARKLVAYLLAVDKSGKRFEVRNPPAKEMQEEVKQLAE